LRFRPGGLFWGGGLLLNLRLLELGGLLGSRLLFHLRLCFGFAQFLDGRRLFLDLGPSLRRFGLDALLDGRRFFL
jgi:hypothetical protein